MMAVPVKDASEASPTALDANPDATAMRAVATGDRAAFSSIYQAHHRRLFRVAYGVLLDVDEAREVVQEAFIRLYEAAGSWSVEAAIGAWLHRVVVNQCLDLRRRLLRAGRHALMSPRSAARAPTPETTTALGEAMGVVERSLRTLPMKQRAVACLFLEAELRPTELAPLVGLSPNAARVTLHRALARLRQDLSKAGVDGVRDPEFVDLDSYEGDA